ncbi:MutS-related protein [Flavihumibacter fluvii]|uniref:MutS-related protein n=1 Tax=Flavihumibacter fluvii TaxID=2838157 RepID=UPI001BDE868A|nr:hypothetical protein [Flavihumibacter fluvii]ULQ53303.1 hypothetical protein KJS93_03100 [Flavihumibacter fluvii]
MNALIPTDWHARQAQQFSIEKTTLQKQKNTIAWARLAIVLLGSWGVIQTWSNSIAGGFTIAALTLGIFLWLLARSLELARKIALLEQKITLHHQEIQFAQHQFTHRFTGATLEPKGHDYSTDLDIFGQASLFQYLHRTTSDKGHQTLAAWLLQPAGNETLSQRQEAVKELAALPEWSIGFEATGQLQPISHRTEEKLAEWMQQPATFQQPYWRLLALIFPMLSLSALLLYLVDIIPTPTFYLLVLVFMVFAFLLTRLVMPQYRRLDKIVSQLSTLSDALQCIETAPFKTTVLKEAQSTLHPDHQPSAGKSIRLLRKILDRFDYRLNPIVFLPLNTFLLWDLQQVLALEKWKLARTDKINRWFGILGEIEALNSFGRFAFNHPQFAYPALSDIAGEFRGIDIGHPLIAPQKRVCNDFSSTGLPAIALITGSNMAGKSTFLRSIGINQVLAMAGSVVCARELTVANMRIMSSMRIADNLEENTSTFYAELRKLKSIIEAVNQHLPVFLLLDEILRGTNSQDRQTGSKALLQQLCRQHACGMLATHDLSLTELSNQYPDAISNYHFDVSVKGEELYFDYTLKPGICQSMNASILMKKIGIDL